MPVNWDDLQEAFEFASFGEPGENRVTLCRKSGKLLYHSDMMDEEDLNEEDLDEGDLHKGDLHKGDLHKEDPKKADSDELPDDEDDGMYVQIPHKKQLDLGKPLVFDFASEFLPRQFNEVQQMFNRRGGYARFRDLLERKHLLDQWYAFEASASEKALKEWCADNDIEIADNGRAGGAREASSPGRP
jgi:hypothetical protein